VAITISRAGGWKCGDIRKKHLGWIKERGGHAGQFLLKYLEDPEKYHQKFEKTIKAEAENNRDSMKKMLEKAKEII